MSEPLEMSKARNAYGKERDRFRRELQWALRQYEDRPLNFEIKQNIRYLAADLKEDCMNAYRHATKSIISNQDPLVGNSLRIQVMANSEDAASSLRRARSPTNRGSRATRTNEDDDDIDAWIARNRSSGATGRSYGGAPSSGTSRAGQPSIPITKLTYGAFKSASTNTHVLSFERQLKADIEQMIDSIDYLDDKNRANWLTIPKSDRTQYFTSKYDDTSYSVHSITTPTRPLFESSIKSSDSSSTTSTTTSTLESTNGANGLAPSEARSYFDSYLKKY